MSTYDVSYHPPAEKIRGRETKIKHIQYDYLSMNFWKMFPLKLSQISTMYG